MQVLKGLEQSNDSMRLLPQSGNFCNWRQMLSENADNRGRGTVISLIFIIMLSPNQQKLSSPCFTLHNLFLVQCNDFFKNKSASSRPKLVKPRDFLCI